MDGRKHGREVPRSWWRLFMAMQGWVALIGAVVLLGLTYWSVGKYADAQELADDGVMVEAVITDRRIRRSRDSTSYYMTFEYVVDAQVVSVRRSVGRSYYNGHRVGGVEDVRYLPQRPRVMDYEEGQTQFNARLLQVMALVTGGGACAMLWFAGGRVNRAVKARRYGPMVVAEVTSWQENVDKNGRKTGRGHMIWREPDGRYGRTLDARMTYLRRWKRGSKIRVYCGVQQGWWEGDVGPRPLRSGVPDVREDEDGH